MTKTPPWKCVGLVGRLLGHSYLSRYGYQEHKHCLRCGMPAGGWLSIEEEGRR